MRPIDFETMLYELLQYEEDAPEIIGVAPFEERGDPTNDCGLVVTTDDGSEFQITIVQSR